MRFYLLVLAVMAAGIGVNTAMAQQPSANAELHTLSADLALHAPPPSPAVPA